MALVFILLVLFQIKHFLADYPLQTPYMLRKFLPDWGFVLPLLAHCGVHALFTFLIAIFLVSWKLALGLALFDLVFHFGMDRIKASPNLLGRFKALTAKDYMDSTPEQKRSNVLFWWSLGVDQMVHHLTHYVIIWFLV